MLPNTHTDKMLNKIYNTKIYEYSIIYIHFKSPLSDVSGHKTNTLSGTSRLKMSLGSDRPISFSVAQ